MPSRKNWNMSFSLMGGQHRDQGGRRREARFVGLCTARRQPRISSAISAFSMSLFLWQQSGENQKAVIKTPSNKPDTPNPATSLRFHLDPPWHRVGDPSLSSVLTMTTNVRLNYCFPKKRVGRTSSFTVR